MPTPFWLTHRALRHFREAPDTARLRAGLTARCPGRSQVHVHWGRRSGGKWECESRELRVRLQPRGQQPPGSATSSFGGRRAGLSWAGREMPPAGWARPPQWDSVPGSRFAQSRRGAQPRRRRPGPGSGGAAPAEGKPSLPSWRPAGPWCLAPAAAARCRGLPGAASWPCCSWSPPRSGCRRRSRVSGVRPEGGGLGLKGPSAGGSRGRRLHPAESCSIWPTAA